MNVKLSLCTAATFRATTAFCAVLSSLALNGGSLYASASSSEARQEIQGDLHRLTAAEATLNYARIKPVVESFFSPRFVLHSPGGKSFNQAQFLQEMQAVTAENRAVKEDVFYPQAATQQGNTITESGVYVFSRTFIDVDKDFGPLNKPHSLNERTQYRCEWTQTGGHWQLQSMYLLGRMQIVDGKLFVGGKKHG